MREREREIPTGSPEEGEDRRTKRRRIANR
jgi:hypothetical protein